MAAGGTVRRVRGMMKDRGRKEWCIKQNQKSKYSNPMNEERNEYEYGCEGVQNGIELGTTGFLMTTEIHGMKCLHIPGCKLRFIQK